MRLFVFLALGSFCLAAAAQPTTNSSEMPARDVERADAELLRKTIERQRAEIAALKGQVDALVAQLRGLGIQPVVGPNADVAAATQPVVRRVVFVRFGYSNRFVNDQIMTAVNDLRADQYFNVLGCDTGKVWPFEPQLVAATEQAKQKLKKYLVPETVFRPNWLDGVEAAAKWRPDVIWLAGAPAAEPEEQTIAELKKRIAGSGSRVNTTLLFAPAATAEQQHFLWRIAHETGGECVDKDGEAIGEPALPVPAAPKPPPPQPKSVLRAR
jgi:hypothetical protein